MIAPAEASANLARFDGVRYGLRVDGDDDLAPDVRAHPLARASGAEVKRRIMLGTYALSSGYYDAYYGQAQRVRTKIADDFRDRLREVRLRGHARPRRRSPSSAASAPQDPLAMYLSDFFTVPMSLAGIPAISIPAGLGAPSGLPVGFQIAGPAFSETRLLDAAHAIESAIGFDGAPPRDVDRGDRGGGARRARLAARVGARASSARSP